MRVYVWKSSNKFKYVLARARADVQYLKKCNDEHEKVERESRRKIVSVTQIYSQHKEAIQKSLDIAETLAAPTSDGNSPSSKNKEQQRLDREKQVERQQKMEKKAREEEEAKQRAKLKKEKKAREAEDDVALKAEYKKNLIAQRGSTVTLVVYFELHISEILNHDSIFQRTKLVFKQNKKKSGRLRKVQKSY